MHITNIIPLNGHIYVEPVQKQQVLVSDSGRLETFGKIIALPVDYPTDICLKVGDYVAFELWDIKDLSTNEKKYYMVRANELICKLELSEEGMVTSVDDHS